jgi:DNA mismatch repair protein MutS
LSKTEDQQEQTKSAGKGKKKADKETPLMGQYNKIKAKYPDALVLFRIGDFYETFGQDAVVTSEVLGIILTKRANGTASEVELSGFPHHALETYLPKLVKAGYRVAICDQLEDPSTAKNVVKRGVTELVTPGVAHNDKILDHKSNNYLASIYFGKDSTGIAFLDISTGEFYVAEGENDHIENLLQSFQPSEVIFPKARQKAFNQTFGSKYYTYPLQDWVYTYDYTRETLLNHFQTQSLKGFGIEELETGTIAAGAAMHYLSETEHTDLQHITGISRLKRDHFVWLDRFSIRNLELINSPHEDGTPLIDVLDKTISPMGSRMLKKWVLMPLKDKEPIKARQSMVTHLIKNPESTDQLKNQIKQLGDVERLISKVPLEKINPREIVQLKKALAAMEPIKEISANSGNEHLEKMADQINPCEKLKDTIAQQLVDEPPALLSKGNVIASGVSNELDELRNIVSSGKDYITGIQERESERTGIPSLKVGFNNVFGYYLEVRNTHKDKVPAEWTRKQTLANAERYITEELKGYEEKIFGAEEKIQSLEEQLFHELIKVIQDYIKPVQVNAQVIAKLDCLIAFADAAVAYNYRLPGVDDSYTVDIKQGRHPVIERELGVDEEYVPNDIYADKDSQQILVITGPNMAGKSAILRQTALIVLMAQMGSFVPADSANIGIVDKVFTRVGASDNISSGESTFMVEMNETASILNNISDRSLILLDEIGRGTSTYDGISLAWAIAEHLHNNQMASPKTLFATHYHELNTLGEQMERMKNFNIATKEAGYKVIFLRKLEEGGCKHSFGIHVAKMAGMPKPIVDRANEILNQLEEKEIGSQIGEKVKNVQPRNMQLSFFSMEDPHYEEVKKELTNLDINTLTPVEAMMKLNELKDKIEGKGENNQ